MANGKLEIVVWDVAHGLAIYMNTPNGRHVLFDAGCSDTFSPVDWLRSHYNIQQIDAFILSHAHSDHVREIGKVWALAPKVFHRNNTVPRPMVFSTDPPPIDPLKTYDSFNRTYVGPVPSDVDLSNPALWGGVTFRLFFNNGARYQFDNLNNYSLVTFAEFGNLVFLFPGDLEEPGWNALLADPNFRVACDKVGWWRILVAPHHGHAAGVHNPTLELFRPDITLISGPYGDEHTDRATYEAASSGCYVYDSTDKDYRKCKVLTTKTNDYVLVSSNGVEPPSIVV